MLGVTVVAVLSRIPVWARLSAVAAVLALIAAVLLDTAPSGGTAVSFVPSPPAGADPAVFDPRSAQVSVPTISDEQLAALPEATTSSKLTGAPLDGDRTAETDGIVAHNSRLVPVFAAPGGKAFAKLPVTQVGSDTWLPVIGQQPGWVRVLLPSRPNGATGWLDASRVDTAHTSYQVRVHLAAKSIELLDDGHPVGSWKTGIGKSSTPTPTGRTFVLASIKDAKQTYSPVILPLGVHSEALDSFGGGPGTVAIHTWPTEDVLGTPISHGCIRVPAAALQVLLDVPLGTLVLITNN